MNDALTMDQKLEILKIASNQDPIDLEDKFRTLVTLITEDRCKKCRSSLKNVMAEIIEPNGVRSGEMA